MLIKGFPDWENLVKASHKECAREGIEGAITEGVEEPLKKHTWFVYLVY